MIFLSEMFAAFITAMMLENLLFARAIDIPGLYEKRSPQQILLIGSILTTIIAVCSVPAYFINTLLLSLHKSATLCPSTGSTVLRWAPC